VTTPLNLQGPTHPEATAPHGPTSPEKKPREQWSLMGTPPGFDRPVHIGDGLLGPKDFQLQFNMIPSTPDFSFVAFPYSDSSQLELVAGESEWQVKSARRRTPESKPVFRGVGRLRLNVTNGTGKGTLHLYGPITLHRR
jgi:hypothetical protein